MAWAGQERDQECDGREHTHPPGGAPRGMRLDQRQARDSHQALGGMIGGGRDPANDILHLRCLS